MIKQGTPSSRQLLILWLDLDRVLVIVFGTGMH
jgi:hypothetical protein